MENQMDRRTAMWASVSAVAAGATGSHATPSLNSLAAAASESQVCHQTAGKRVIRFPRDRSLGWIEWSAQLGGGDDVVARGDVAVPAGVPIRLLMIDDPADAFAELRGLQPDDLTELYGWFVDGMVDLGHVAHLSGLRVLELTDVQVMASQPFAPSLRGLRRLTLNSTFMNPDCLELVSRCPELRRLDLHGSQMPNGDFTALRGPKTLRRIDMAFSNVTDDGLIDPADFPMLEVLDLGAALVSHACVAELRRRFPHVAIQRFAGS